MAFGPVKEEDLPLNAKVNGIMCKEKPNGSVRIILNLSLPEALSVNDGIDKDEFPGVDVFDRAVCSSALLRRGEGGLHVQDRLGFCI